MPKHTFPAAAGGLSKAELIGLSDTISEIEIAADKLRLMAIIAEDSLTDALFPGVRKEGAPHWVYFGDEDRDLLAFTVGDVTDRSRELRDKLAQLLEQVGGWVEHARAA